MNILERISQAWAVTPAVVTAKEISRKDQLPRWQDCAKNAVHVGVIRRKRGDRLIIVKHQITHELDLRCEAEDLTDNELFQYGFVPTSDQICDTCGEFASRINVDGNCQDCPQKAKRDGETA